MNACKCHYQIMNAVNQGGKRKREGVGWEATLNQGEAPSFLDTCYVWLAVTKLFFSLATSSLLRQVCNSCKKSVDFFWFD